MDIRLDSVTKSVGNSMVEEYQKREWTGQEAVRYEAALEAINGAVGAYSALIAREEAKPEPDPAVIAEAEQGRSECAKHRKQLDPADAEQVAHTRSRFSQLAREIRERSR
ncbi:hypothetical protein FHX37_3764 [Haloactinospora alba]|uniref:Uncharacterized protein n=1 Tax=Haloactinospora alba TaxID=405555 RepID=A0A543N9D8_9ACTN|nr:hypothetical protein [Haloactinospora alba]TQN28420.1 hypothetical protein FHX37_3764 [Haloactinospora alba]